MAKGLGYVGNSLPGDDGSEEDDANGEAYVGGSRSKNIPHLLQGRGIFDLPALVVYLRFQWLILLPADPMSKPLVFTVLTRRGLIVPGERKNG